MGGSSSEEAAELVATIRSEHVVMKTWFNGDSPDAVTLREKYGSYPGLWKEVLNWPGWKEARKAYLKSAQGGNGAAVKEDFSSPAKTTNDSSSDNKSGDSVPKKRRSRWGKADASNDDNDNDGNTANKRRSRWGRDDAAGATSASSAAAPTAAVTMNSTSSAAVPGHYGPAAGAAPVLKPLPGLGLPGMPTNLTPQQQEEMRELQGRLREINEKLDNLEREAARVDELPRGHRERSPSPPPGTFSCFRMFACIESRKHCLGSITQFSFFCCNFSFFSLWS